MGEPQPKPRGFIVLALNAEVRAAGNRWRHELVPLEDVDERLSHAAIKAITAYLGDLKGRVVAGVQFGGMHPLCLPCRDPVPNQMTVGLMSADIAEPNVIIVNAICERCAALPLDVLQEDCQAAFAEWIKDLKMVKDNLMTKSRFTTDETEIRMLSATIRTVDLLTDEERATNEAHDEALAEINAELRGDTSRFVAQRDEIEMLGRVVEVEDRTTPEQKARNAEHRRLMKELYPDEA